MIKHYFIFILIILFLSAFFGCSKKMRQNSPGTLPLYLDGFEYQELNNKGNDCGPVQQFNCLRYLGYDYSLEFIKDKMGWSEQKPNITDTPLNHKKLLEYLGVNFTLQLNTKEDEIKPYLYRGLPVMVLIETDIATYHWISITGWQEDRWIIAWGSNDPSAMYHSVFSAKFTGVTIFFNARKA